MLDGFKSSDSDALGAPVLDAGCLEQLRALDPSGGMAFVNRVLGTYLRSLDRQLELSAAARAIGEFETVGRAAHTLKSASASVGALTLSRYCQEVEQRIRRQELEGIDIHIDKLFAEVARVRQAVQAMLGANDA
ncbi:MAG TPA: Hpt domain-containing protein [Ideonella sp.]|nr:Hpt domain-containing protein [Ideonella sp.]